MPGTLSSLDPHQAVLPVIAVLGLVPVVLRYRSESKWFVIGYVLLLVATLSTNLESLFLGTLLNYAEHVLGLMGSGIAFLLAAYLRRQAVVETDDDDATTHESDTTVEMGA